MASTTLYLPLIIADKLGPGWHDTEKNDILDSADPDTAAAVCDAAKEGVYLAVRLLGRRVLGGDDE